MADVSDQEVLRYIMGIAPGGAPMVRNPDGTVSTERTMTASHPALNQGRWTNFPTMWNAEQLRPGSALSRAIMRPGGFPSYETLEEAEAAARQKSRALGDKLALIETLIQPSLQRRGGIDKLKSGDYRRR